MEHNLPADVLEGDRGQSPWGQWAQKSRDLIRRPQQIAGPDDLIGEKSRIDASAASSPLISRDQGLEHRW
jgi:hypothetical protein